MTLALGRPDIPPQSPVTVQGFRPEIDATQWQAVKLTHTLGNEGLTTRIELERVGTADEAPSDVAEDAGRNEADDDGDGDISSE
ncbi:hypothetical protein [Paracidovorax avenae]|uniref:hypothetical protein n=1 Tax=Paracidovorax avenae TaxID=80867 RepID=UPI003390E3BC